MSVEPDKAKLKLIKVKPCLTYYYDHVTEFHKTGDVSVNLSTPLLLLCVLTKLATFALICDSVPERLRVKVVNVAT